MFLQRFCPSDEARDVGVLPRTLRWGACIALVASVLLGGCSEPPADVSYERAQTHEADGKYQEALFEYRRAAQNGHPQAMHRLADVLRTGTFSSADGRPLQFIGRDTATASDWYEQAARAYRTAAEQGSTDAQVHLGELRYQGFGVLRDTSIALDWWQRAASTGHPEALYRLAVARFDAGAYAASLRSVRRSAEQKHAASEAFLAFLLQDGYGTSSNPDSAMYWLQRAAAHGDSSAIYQIRALENAPATTELDSTR